MYTFAVACVPSDLAPVMGSRERLIEVDGLVRQISVKFKITARSNAWRCDLEVLSRRFVRNWPVSMSIFTRPPLCQVFSKCRNSAPATG